LGNGPYAVEILFTINDDLVISAQRVEGPESFIIEIEKSKVDGLLKEFEGEMAYMAQFLRLQDKRMVLINPKFQPPQPENNNDAEEGENQPEGEEPNEMEAPDNEGEGVIDGAAEEASPEEAEGVQAHAQPMAAAADDDEPAAATQEVAPEDDKVD